TPLVRRRLSRNPRINIKGFDADLLINITRDRDNSEEEKHDTHADAGVSLSCVSVRWWESRISRRNKKATSRIALVRGRCAVVRKTTYRGKVGSTIRHTPKVS